jgi:hypothetical protein
MSEMWKDYYRLRNVARLTLLALPVGLGVLLAFSEPLSLRLSNLSSPWQITVIFSGIGLATVLVSIPLLKWAEWPCPRCGRKFAQPKVPLGKFVFVQLLWRLIFDSSCANCGLESGDSPSASFR